MEKQLEDIASAMMAIVDKVRRNIKNIPGNPVRLHKLQEKWRLLQDRQKKSCATDQE